ncbi:30S ribosomal protein S6 [Geobacter sp. DSM 9736]|uniref:30S ribosomal protein S6 n=1 Tax=Geobacter sp. DSM 9736 TaxID=1277350 RepID=UPI000B500385|nr:30S ribosomal protein S6 [Geobacter sp. DSM 9736]SNB48054.1 small subunit ribosomal protein S6 [Geobacter sp. DSM 9736]
MNRMYETIFIVQPDLADEDLKSLAAKVQDVVASFKGDLKKLEDWGMRKLAYPINKVSRGRYYYLRFDGSAALIAELERRLRLDDKVIRYQSVKLETETVAPAAVPAPAEQERPAEPAEAPAAETE